MLYLVKHRDNFAFTLLYFTFISYIHIMILSWILLPDGLMWREVELFLLIKVKSLCLTNHHAMKTYGGVEL